MMSRLPLPLLVLCACAGDVGDVDRTQPGKLRKDALEGDWYFRQTVIDVPFANALTFIGEQSLLERVRWEVSEQYLTAYRAYERVEGAEAPSVLPGQQYQGAPVAAFAVLSHFDVVREYEAATGEQTNVIIENDFDRPWYERTHMRVDWSKNLLANFDFLSAGDHGWGVLTQAASYAVTDPRDPDAPVFGVRDGAGWVDHRDPAVWGSLATFDYFDLTLKLQMTPDSFEMEWDDGTTETWPACWFYDIGPWDCASQTVKVRASFLRAQPSDYEPLYYPDNYVARHADGSAIRVGVDADGFAVRCAPDDVGCDTVRVPMFDLFGYFRTEREAYDRDYNVTEEGRVYLINRHNIWQRSTDANGQPLPPAARTVKPIVYYLSAGFPASMEAAAYQVGAWWNAAFTDTVRSLKNGADVGAVFQVRPNTYRVGPDGTILDFGQRNGDLRYNQLHWVDQPHFDSLLGYGPSAADPLTGEIIAADAYVYGAAVDEYGTFAADIIELMRGDILEDEFIAGENVGQAVARIRNGSSQSRETARRQVDREMQRGLGERLRGIRQVGRNRFRANHDWVGSRLRLADGDPRFDALWSTEVSRALEDRFGRLEPSKMSPRRIARARARQHRELGARGLDLVRGFEDSGVLQLMDELQRHDRPQIMQQVRHYVYASVAAHEIGHSIGLRHNFAGSTDALNYLDPYWAIRVDTAQALDLPTRAEQQAGLREYSYSSIMDYGAKFISDIRGIGKYDVAAVKFGYGQLLEAFVNPPSGHPMQYIYWLDELVQDWLHYTDLPRLFASSPPANDGVANMQQRRDVPMQQVIDWMTASPRAAEDFTDKLVPYKFCSDEYDGALWDCATWDEGADPYEIVSYAAQDYRDYYIFSAFKRHQRYLDAFAYYDGIYSRTMLPLSTQYQMWVFDQWYKAGEWEYLNDLAEDWATDPQDPYPDLQLFLENRDWNLDPHGGLAQTAASVAALNFLAEVVATPEPGSYYLDPANNGTLLWWTNGQDRICTAGESSSVDDCSDLYVPIGDGRYALSEFDDETGYYWYERLRVVGSFWDKLAAIETLSDPSTYFLGVDDVGDFSQFILGFNVAFPHTVGGIFGAVVNDDYRKFSYELQPNGSMTLDPILDTIPSGLADVPAPDRSGPFVDPATNFTVSLYTLYYGMALLPANFDQTFNDNAKIWLQGSGEAFTPAAGAEVESFTNPWNNRIYTAVRSTDPAHYSLGWEMVRRARLLAAALVGSNCVHDTTARCADQRWELSNLVENIELVRGYYDVYGYSWW